MSDALARPPETAWRLSWRRFRRHRIAVAALFVLASIILACAATPLFVSESRSLELDFSAKMKPPSTSHPFGTNELGQDYLARSLYGGRVSLRVGLQATIVALLVGTLLGSVAGFRGGWIDNAIMRGVDVMLSIPIFFVLLLLGSYFGSNIQTVTFIIGLTSWTDVCRLVRADFLGLREKEFVEAARALGASAPVLIVRHLLPNAASPIIVAATLGVARAIVVESALSYLGFGVQPPAASWGYMLRSAQSHLQDEPWLAFFPGLLIFVTVLACNFIGDGLRDALDPRTGHR